MAKSKPTKKTPPITIKKVPKETRKISEKNLPLPSVPNSHKKSLRRFFPQRLLWQILIAIVSFLIIALILVYFTILRDLPSPRKLTTAPYAISTKIYDRNDKLLYEIFAAQNRTPIKMADLPENVKYATISIEDRNFYQHPGLAWTGIIRAILNNFAYFTCQIPFIGCRVNLQGGSTITQQLVKNALLTPDRTFQRKIKEIILTFAVEALYSKDQILEMYLNEIPYGGTAYGLEAAAHTYFNKSSKDLNLAEISVLAGLPVAPTKYSPFGSDPNKYKERQEAVLRRMVEDKFITQDQATQALQTPLTFATPNNLINAPHFVLWVKELLVDEYGQQQVETGGLRVKTSIDLSLQQTAQASVSAEIATLTKSHVTNGAALITNPNTGEILSMIGSQDYYNDAISGKVNVTLSSRQPGSSIKPLNYTLAFFKHQLSPGNIIADIPTCFQTTGQPSYCPQNYDGSYHGAISLRTALANSYNIPAVKILALNGVSEFINYATIMGITGWDDTSRYGLSLTLGGGEVRMVDMAVAYSVLANLGVKVPLHPILKVTNFHGDTLQQLTCTGINPDGLTSSDSENLYAQDCQASRVFPPGPPYLTTQILSDQNARSLTFGGGLNITGHPEVAVKTGTTNNLHDNWTIGYTPTRLVAVWVGNNDNTPMSRVASGITGASPIWRSLMKQTLIGQPIIRTNPPEGIIGTQICSLTGNLPVDGCPTSFDLFPKDKLPNQAATLIRPWPIDATTGFPSTSQTPPEQIQMQDHPIVFDILGNAICTDCALDKQNLNLQYPFPDITLGNTDNLR